MKKEKEFEPFGNGGQAVLINDFNIENGEDLISVFGELEITKDKDGLKKAEQLSALFQKIASTLQKTQDLPNRIKRADDLEKEPIKVINPFKN